MSCRIIIFKMVFFVQSIARSSCMKSLNDIKYETPDQIDVSL